ARETHASNLAQRRVRLLGRRRVDACAHAAALGRALQGRRLRLGALGAAALADQLLDGGHALPLPNCCKADESDELWRTGHAGGPAHRTDTWYGRRTLTATRPTARAEPYDERPRLTATSRCRRPKL